MIVARFRKCRDLVREGKVFVRKIKLRFRAEWVVVREEIRLMKESLGKVVCCVSSA